MKVPTPVMIYDLFLEILDNDSDDEFDYDFIDDGEMAGEYASLFTPQQSTTEYDPAIQIATKPQTINHPYHFHLESYKHLINFAKSDPAASEFIGSLLNEYLQKMVEFTTAIGPVETPVAELPMTHDFAHLPTAKITSSHCPMHLVTVK
jgi:hypothetical protein